MSHLQGYHGNNQAYIASQGPTGTTVADFWRMIWQERINCVVMLTDLIENAKVYRDWKDPLVILVYSSMIGY